MAKDVDAMRRRHYARVYSNPGSETQLAGLSTQALKGWVFDHTLRHGVDGLTTLDESGLGVFWATKIGGPSHGFDYEGQCLLPLIANARHKVILVSDPSWPHHPVGRAHFRLLHLEDGETPVLWMEAMNVDFQASGVDDGAFLAAAVAHAALKAKKMGVALSLDARAKQAAQRAIESRVPELWGDGASLEVRQHRLVLRPSVGVVEASDYLSHKHDWVQTVEETTREMRRLIYTPSSAVAVFGREEGGVNGGEL